MGPLILSRAAGLVVALVAASVLIFVVVNVLPGDPASVILGTAATPGALAQLRQQLGLDQPAWVRYLEWVGGMLHGDFGISPISRIPVGPEILQKLTVSAPLALGGTLVALVVAIPLGALAGIRHRRPSGVVISALSLGGMAVPAFWAGLLLISLFAVRLQLVPSGGFVPWSQDPLGSLTSLALPCLALGLVQGAVLTRYVRSAVIDVQRQDFMRTARAQGLSRWQALVRHGFRNAAIPVVTVLGIQLTSLIVGAVVIENVFDLPGLGLLLFQAVGNRDLVTVQDLVMLLTAAVLVVNLVVDLSYRLLDPRIRAR